MGRPPCCDKVGIKKGPWTPEEDIILVSYIQEHGPGNWRSVPTNTGLLRCSKSCRLRWTNYLRPGIKRGNFTPQEEGMIIHLQALLGNKWAAIASYLPQRTDNDIKNYWNTHLKKKLKRFQSASDPNMAHHHLDSSTTTSASTHFLSNGTTTSTSSFHERRGLDHFTSSANTSNNHLSSSSSTTYASSTENISRLLEGWMRSSPKPTNAATTPSIDHPMEATRINHPYSIGNNKNLAATTTTSASSLQCYRPKSEQLDQCNDNSGGELMPHEEFESILSFENLNNVSWDKSSSTNCDSSADAATTKRCQLDCASEEKDKNSISNNLKLSDQKKHKSDHSTPPLSFLEKWLLDENGAAQVEEALELSSIF